MNQRIKNKTYFNLAFIPLLLIIGFLGIEFIDEIDVEYKTDQMFDDRLGYSFLFLFFLAVILLVWLTTAADTCFQTRFYKKWLFLNLLSIGWLPFTITIWYLYQKIPIYIEKKNFKKRFEDQVDVAKINTIDLDTDEPILTSYLFNNNFYILTGEDLSRKASLRLFNQEILLSPT